VSIVQWTNSQINNTLKRKFFLHLINNLFDILIIILSTVNYT
jgi:hypothetical protein